MWLIQLRGCEHGFVAGKGFQTRHNPNMPFRNDRAAVAANFLT